MAGDSKKKKKKQAKRIPRPRGLDFLIRNEQGRWAEDLVIVAINHTQLFRAVRYGVSRAFLAKGGKEWVEYWKKYKRIEKYGKRPDVIVFKKDTYDKIECKLGTYERDYGDTSLIPEEVWYNELRLCEAVCSIEVEMSLWKASKMRDKDMKLPLERIRDIIAPMIWVKEEDAKRIMGWCERYREKCCREIPVYVIQVFYDQAYIALLKLILEKVQKIKSCSSRECMIEEVMMREGLIVEKRKYIDVSGVSVRKTVYRLHPAGGAKVFGYLREPPEIKVEVLEDDKGKIIPYLRFSGGKLEINNAILEEWLNIEHTLC